MGPVEMTPERWAHTRAYIREVFAREDAHLAGLMRRAVEAGLPDIDAGPETGRLLQLLATVLGAGLVVEVGTLAGVSAIWLARGVRPGGRVITIELDPKHQALAKREVAAAGVADRVDFRLGRGGEVIPKLVDELGAGSVDLAFLDAARPDYLPMMPAVKALLRPGGMLVIDNGLNAGRWVADPYGPGETIDIMDTINRAIAADPDFAVTHLLPVGNGVTLAVR